MVQHIVSVLVERDAAARDAEGDNLDVGLDGRDDDVRGLEIGDAVRAAEIEAAVRPGSRDFPQEFRDQQVVIGLP